MASVAVDTAVGPVSPSAAAPAKLRKADLASAAASFHRARISGSNGASSVATNSSTSAVDPVARALARVGGTSQESYDAFVRSFGDDCTLERVGVDGHNELSSRKEPAAAARVPPLIAALEEAEAERNVIRQEHSDEQDAAASEPSISTVNDANATAVALPTIPAATPVAGSDFLELMRLLAADKERLSGSTRLITGDEQEEGSAGVPPRSSASALAASFSGAHIRVDDSYGFVADPFAPESRPRDENEVDAEDDDEAQARVRVLGDDESDALGEDATEEEDLASSQLESALFTTEEEAGASLESVPVEDDYLYDAEKDNLTPAQFHAQRSSQSRAQVEEIVDSVLAAATTTASPAAPTASDASLSARAASRLGADLESASRSTPSNALSSTDEVEAFSYDPTTGDADGEEPPVTAVQDALRSAVAVQRAAQSLASSEPATAVAPRIAPASSSSSSSVIHRPISSPSASLTSASSSSSATVGDDGIETVDLDDETSTSVPIFAKLTASSTSSASSASITASSSATLAAPASKVGNFLDPMASMGFEDADSSASGTRTPTPTAAASNDPHDNDISDMEDAEWLDVDELDQAENEQPTYTPSQAPRIKRRF